MYILFYLLFKIATALEKEAAFLAITENCADKIITLYHTGMFAGHLGVIKTYLMINDKFTFYPKLDTLSDILH